MKNKNNTLTKIMSYLANTDTRILFTVPFVLAGFLAFVWSYFSTKINMPKDPSFVVTLLILLLIGSGGFGVIIKREFPTTISASIRGLPAVIFGVVWILFWWGLALPGAWKILINTIR